MSIQVCSRKWYRDFSRPDLRLNIDPFPIKTEQKRPQVVVHRIAVILHADLNWHCMSLSL